MRFDELGGRRAEVALELLKEGEYVDYCGVGLRLGQSALQCTPQNCAYRDHHAELTRLGAAVFGLSTQPTSHQLEMATRLHLPYPVLSDEQLQLTHALRLPTFQYGEWTLIKRLAPILDGARVAHVVYPVFPSNADAPAVVSWLRDRAAAGA